MDILKTFFFLCICTVLQLALGQESEVDNNVGISGCNEIEIEDAPFMAGFLHNGVLVCSGSIVHRQFILTSASCGKTWSIRRAHVGTNKAGKGGYFVDVAYTVCHEQFNINTLDNNICLLKLRKPLFTLKGGRSEIALVDLPEKDINTAPGTMVNVTGWGSMYGIHDISKNLQQATISVLSDAVCSPLIRYMTDNMLCAGYEGQDSCRGDQGGPLTQNNVQLGIVSLGPAESYGRTRTVYTKVSKYVTWITETIDKNL